MRLHDRCTSAWSSEVRESGGRRSHSQQRDSELVVLDVATMATVGTAGSSHGDTGSRPAIEPDVASWGLDPTFWSFVHRFCSQLTPPHLVPSTVVEGGLRVGVPWLLTSSTPLVIVVLVLVLVLVLVIGAGAGAGCWLLVLLLLLLLVDTHTHTHTHTHTPAPRSLSDGFLDALGNAVSLVEVHGVVVMASRRANLVQYAVDDGTGTVDVIVWRNKVCGPCETLTSSPLRVGTHPRSLCPSIFMMPVTRHA
jgi:hypothetical protein